MNAEYLLPDERNWFSQIHSQPYSLVCELLSRLAELRERDRWISVEEKLPERDGFIMCAVRGLDYAVPHFHTIGGLKIGNQVTHWRPLPAPPEAK